jgi:hypothetical protein
MLFKMKLLLHLVSTNSSFDFGKYGLRFISSVLMIQKVAGKREELTTNRFENLKRLRD